MFNESSIWVQSISNFEDAVMGRVSEGEATVDDIALAQTMGRSNYRTHFQSRNDNAERVAVAWAGIPEILDHFQGILASIAGIPMTRWNAQSPAGMNATGTSDANNWALTVAGKQREMVDPVLKRLDPFIARHAGLAEPPEYEWVPLTDISELEQAEIDERRTKMAGQALNDGFVDEDEVRERVSQIEWWGELKANWEPPTDPAMEMDAELNAARIKQMSSGNGGNGNGAR